jgi:hypothetical protein
MLTVCCLGSQSSSSGVVWGTPSRRSTLVVLAVNVVWGILDGRCTLAVLAVNDVVDSRHLELIYSQFLGTYIILSVQLF